MSKLSRAVRSLRVGWGRWRWIRTWRAMAFAASRLRPQSGNMGWRVTLHTSSVLSNPDRMNTLPCVMLGAVCVDFISTQPKSTHAILSLRTGHVGESGRDEAVHIVDDVDPLGLVIIRRASRPDLGNDLDALRQATQSLAHP